MLDVNSKYDRPWTSKSARESKSVWFVLTSESRVRVNEAGVCVFDNGEKKSVLADGNALKLDDGYILSTQKSSRKMLFWEKDGELLQWAYEMPGGSRQVTLNLDVEDVIRGHCPYGLQANQQRYSTTTSLALVARWCFDCPATQKVPERSVTKTSASTSACAKPR